MACSNYVRTIIKKPVGIGEGNELEQKVLEKRISYVDTLHGSVATIRAKCPIYLFVRAPRVNRERSLYKECFPGKILIARQLK